MWNWRYFFRCVPKQTSVNFQFCSLPVNTAAPRQQPGRLEPILCLVGFYSHSEAIRGPATGPQRREFTVSQKQQPNRWPLEYWSGPLCIFSFFFTSLKWPKFCPAVCQWITACMLTNTGTIKGTFLQWYNKTQSLSQQWVLGRCFRHVLSSGPQSQLSVRRSLRVGACNTASWQDRNMDANMLQL